MTTNNPELYEKKWNHIETLRMMNNNNLLKRKQQFKSDLYHKKHFKSFYYINSYREIEGELINTLLLKCSVEKRDEYDVFCSLS